MDGIIKEGHTLYKMSGQGCEEMKFWRIDPPIDGTYAVHCFKIEKNKPKTRDGVTAPDYLTHTELMEIGERFGWVDIGQSHYDHYLNQGRNCP